MTDNHYKLLVVDIDGTLLGSSGRISAEDKSALSDTIDSGIRVSVSTGRAVQACLRIIDQLCLDGYHIFFDGALVADVRQGKEVYVRPINEDLVRQVIEFAHHNEINLDLYSLTRYFAERETWATDVRRKFFGTQPTIGSFGNLWEKERIIKGTLVVCSPEERARAESFYQRFKSSLSFSRTKTPAYPDVDFINVVALAVSKGKALEALVSHLGIPMNEVMAIGDGDNDVSLLSTAGLAVAMGNAPDELKAIADYVTLDVDHGGAAAAIKKFLLS